MNALEIMGLKKSFGSHQVIDGLEMAVPEHCVFGFLGPNGAGKTTTMKMILGLLKPDEGNIHVFEREVSYGGHETNRSIGYLPDVPEFYGYMRPKEYLRLCGEITGLKKEKTDARSKELLDLVGLGDVHKKIGGFSRGMKQRLGIAQALLNEPRLLICDEPTSSLDPVGRKEILEILERVKGQTTVVFSTHILADVERICDRVAVLYEGKAVMQGGLEELKAQHRRNSLVVAFGRKEMLEEFLHCTEAADLPLEPEVKGAEAVLHLKGELLETEKKILALCTQKNLMPTRLEVVEPTLESLFLEVVK